MDELEEEKKRLEALVPRLADIAEQAKQQHLMAVGHLLGLQNMIAQRAAKAKPKAEKSANVKDAKTSG